MIRTLVVDDEPLARERVRSLLGQHPDVELLAECGDGLSCLTSLREHTPDLLLLDIEMPGLDGLDVVATRRREGPLPLIVFVTAYDRHALAAFDLHALDYLLKPIDEERFRAALTRVRALLAGQERLEVEGRIAALLEERTRRRSRPQHLVARDGDRYVLLREPEIQCIEATGNYASVHVGKTAFLLRETLTALADRLDPERFLRTHRSWIVNLDHVREAYPAPKGHWVLVTDSGREVPLSAQHRDVLEKVLGARR